MRAISRRLVVVTPDLEVLQLLSTFLRDNTVHRVISTNNPAEALGLVRQGEADLVISELKMPGLDGEKLLAEIGGLDTAPPVILTSAYGSVATALDLKRKGAYSVLMRPFRKEQLFAAIENALAAVQLARENRRLRDQLRQGGAALVDVPAPA